MCNNCIHKAVCSKFAATGGHVRECEHFREDRNGEWLKTKEQLGWNEVDAVECSECHESWLSDEDDTFDYLEHWFYCPNCGADMR